MHQYYEDNQLAVFSEIVQKYNPKLQVSEHIICVTSQAIYLLDLKSNLEVRIEIRDLSEIILIKKNPCIFALVFKKGIASLVLQSLRRSELVVYILAQRENLPKPKVQVGDKLRVYPRGKPSYLIEFDKAFQGVASSSDKQKRLF